MKYPDLHFMLSLGTIHLEVRLYTSRHEQQGRRQVFWFGGANLAAVGSPAESVATDVARGVRGHAPPPPQENIEILGCLRRILMLFEAS